MGTLKKRVLTIGVAVAAAAGLSLFAALPSDATITQGVGTVTVAPTTVTTGSTGNTLTFTYAADGTDALSGGAVQIVFPSSWGSAPSTGDTSGTCISTDGGIASVVSTYDLQVTGVTLAATGSCTIIESASTADPTSQTDTFISSEQSGGGTLTELSTTQPTVTTTTAANGSGSIVVAPSTATPSTTNNTLTFTYTASSPAGLDSGQLDITVPAGWTVPQTGNATAARYVTTTCPGVSLSIVTTTTISLTGLSLSGGGSCSVTYGATSGGGPGSADPTSAQESTFTTTEASTSGPTPVALAVQPVVLVGVADGTGTILVSPTAVNTSSTGNTLTFTYTAAAAGTSNGELVIIVPSGWSNPTTTPGGTGYVVSTCGGALAVVATDIEITGLTLGSGASCTVTYGSTASGSTGATAPTTAQISTFTTLERSTSGGVLTSLVAQPQVVVGGIDGLGTMTVTPTTVALSSTGNTLTFTYTAAATGLSAGEIAISVPSGWSTPSTTTTAPGYTTSTCGTVTVVGQVIEVAPVTLPGAGICTITYGSTASSGPGVTAPSTAAIYTFTTQEESTNDSHLTALATSPQVTVGTPGPIQIYGTDAIGTSIAISEQDFTAGSAGGVVLARDDFFSDALAGGPLAAAVNGPLLITEGGPSGGLDARVQAEIQRVLPAGGTVYVLGGDLALPASVDSTLQGLGYVVVREAGTDEYATAIDIAIQLGNPGTVFEATGLNFYDALSAVPAAIEEHAAILLTDGNVQSPETGFYLLVHPGDARYTIGGSLAAGGADPSATNISGADLFSTSAAVASTFFPDASEVGAATSADFPDALGGGVFMVTHGHFGPLLLVNQTAPLPTEITPYLAGLPVDTQVYVFGGPIAVGSSVLAALQAAIG